MRFMKRSLNSTLFQLGRKNFFIRLHEVVEQRRSNKKYDLSSVFKEKERMEVKNEVKGQK